MIVAYVGRTCRVSPYYTGARGIAGKDCRIVEIGPTGSLPEGMAKVQIDESGLTASIRVSELREKTVDA